MQRSLTTNEIRNRCDPSMFDVLKHTVASGEQILIGQDRALKALQLGLGMKSQGFNIYVSGPEGTGRLTAVTGLVQKLASTEKVPTDWCYVNNFRDSYQPAKLALPAGTALGFMKDMKGLIRGIYNALMKAFESEEFASKRQRIVNKFEDKQAAILGGITDAAERSSFAVKQTAGSIITVPVKDGKPLTDAELKAMKPDEVETINKKQSELQDTIGVGLREIRKLEKATDNSLDNLAREVAELAIGNLITELDEHYKSETVSQYLNLLKQDIMDNLPEFMKQQIKHNGSGDSDFLNRYDVTVLVDNAALNGAPVVIEANPTYNNLIGRVEKETHMGTLVTDFTMIRNGALHRANGGYLIIRIEELVKNYFAWDCLKRALKNKEIVIEEAADQLGYLTTRSLKPQPIPLNVKVILIGNAYYYQLLYQYDSDFRELFKVKADFDSQMPRTTENMACYYDFVQKTAADEGLPAADNEAVARIVEYSSRLAGDQQKLSTWFGDIADVVREAGFYAGADGASVITARHINRAIEQRVYRSGLIQEQLTEMIASRQIFIDVTGEKIGQINGLSVIDIGDVSFGLPSRITCSTGLGKEGIVNIEREAEMSGPLHTKGVLILGGYLTTKFLQDRPGGISARLVFEQNYSGVEGDSASSTELYAILSSLSAIPIKQGIAVTGSVNQKGEIQPIGGVNEKVEGFFEVCSIGGLTGSQGVLIPSANVRNLMLKDNVAEAVDRGLFHIWAIDTVEDGIEILTGVKAGSIWEDGTIFWYVHNAIGMYNEKMRAAAGGEEDVIEIG